MLLRRYLRYHTSSHIHNFKLLNHTFHYDIRKHFFSARIVNIWNSMPNSVVKACSVKAFKARLDKVWLHLDVKFDFRASLTGIGNRSQRIQDYVSLLY